MNVQRPPVARNAFRRLRAIGFSETVVEEIQNLQRTLPVSRVSGFEWALGHQTDALDFVLCYRTGDYDIEAAIAGDRFPASSSWLIPGIGSYTGIAPHRSPYWLEYDLSRRQYRPSFFIACPRSSDPIVLARPVAAALQLAYASDQLAAIVPHVPAHATVFQVGWLPHRDPDSLRVCIDGFDLSSLRTFLSTVPWRGSPDTLVRQITPLAPHADQIGIGFDVKGGIVQQRIGIEYGFRGSKSSVPRQRWRDLLQEVQAGGLCTQTEREMLLAWMGSDLDQANEGLFAPSGTAILNPSIQLSHEYGLHHLKTVHLAHTVAAKAYFGYALFLKPVTL